MAEKSSLSHLIRAKIHLFHEKTAEKRLKTPDCCPYCGSDKFDFAEKMLRFGRMQNRGAAGGSIARLLVLLLSVFFF